jgi:hypothetical protein
LDMHKLYIILYIHDISLVRMQGPHRMSKRVGSITSTACYSLFVQEKERTKKEKREGDGVEGKYAKKMTYAGLEPAIS